MWRDFYYSIGVCFNPFKSAIKLAKRQTTKHVSANNINDANTKAAAVAMLTAELYELHKGKRKVSETEKPF